MTAWPGSTVSPTGRLAPIPEDESEVSGSVVVGSVVGVSDEVSVAVPGSSLSACSLPHPAAANSSRTAQAAVTRTDFCLMALGR